MLHQGLRGYHRSAPTGLLGICRWMSGMGEHPEKMPLLCSLHQSGLHQRPQSLDGVGEKLSVCTNWQISTLEKSSVLRVVISSAYGTQFLRISIISSDISQGFLQSDPPFFKLPGSCLGGITSLRHSLALDGKTLLELAYGIISNWNFKKLSI